MAYNPKVLERLKLKRAKEAGLESFTLMQKIEENQKNVQQVKEKIEERVTGIMQELENLKNDMESGSKSREEISTIWGDIDKSVNSLFSHFADLGNQNEEIKKIVKGLEKKIKESDNKNIEIVIE